MLVGGTATVVLLNRLSQSQREVVVSVLTRSVIKKRSDTTFAEKRLALDPTIDEAVRQQLMRTVEHGVPRTTIMLDEAQSFLSPGSRSACRELFVRLVKEGRNMGLGRPCHADPLPPSIDVSSARWSASSPISW